MPTMPRKDYDEMRKGSRAMQDSLQDMVKAGYTPEPLPQAPKPSFRGFLGHLKEKAGEAVNSVTRPQRLIDIGRRAREMGAGMREAADLNSEMKKPGGLNMDRWNRIEKEKKKRMEE